MNNSRLYKQEPFLRLLQRSNASVRKQLLANATKEELTTLFEICLNILKGNIPSSLKRKCLNNKTLKNNKSILRTLGNKKIPFTQKKAIVQQGKGIGTIATVASLILPLLGKLIK